LKNNFINLVSLLTGLVFLQVWGNTVQAQSPGIKDSLLNVLKYYKANNIEDSNTVFLYQKLVDASADTDLKESLSYAEDALRIANKLGKKDFIASSYNFFGKVYRDQGLTELALRTFFKVLKIWEELGDKRAQTFALNDVGNIYFDQKDYPRAEQFYKQALQIGKSIDFKEGMSVSLNNLGLVQTYQKRNAQALPYFMRALELRKQLNDPTLVPHSHNYIAKTYFKLGQYDSAIAHFNEGIKLCKPIVAQANSLMGAMYGSLAQLYVKQGDEQQALSYFIMAEELYKKYNNERSLAVLYAGMGDYYKQAGETKKALQYYLKANSLAESHQLLDFSKEINKGISELYAGMKNYDLAYKYYVKYASLEDSLAKNNNLRQILSLAHRYELDKKEDALKDAESFNRYQHAKLLSAQRNTQLLIVVILASILTVVLLIYFYWHKSKINKQLHLHNDIIEKQNAEIEEKNKELLIAKEVAESVAQHKSDFLSNMSHEIRTPMSGIMGFVNLLLEDKSLNEEQRTRLLSINYSADKLMHIINDVLHLSTIEAGSILLERQPLNIRKFCEEIISNIQASQINSNVKFALNIQQNVPKTIIADPTRLYQILLNLLGNAKKFTHQGWIRLNIFAEETPQPDKVLIRFEIADTGIGIPADKLESIFESFQQANSGIIKKYGGTGLGLAIARKLVHLKGGKISVASKVGEGSTFTVEIPFSYTDDTYANITKQVEINRNIDLSGMRVLLVEDNEINQMVISQQLKKWNVLVEVAKDGYTALETLKQKLFDLVLLDIQMPGINGFETVKEIRYSKTYTIINPFVPVIGLTADVFDETRRNALIAGMNDVLTKPAKPADLHMLLSRYYTPAEVTPTKEAKYR
jgi:signal transduction histidine kinase/CheY-like chemotaxis protein/Tfp pilus assembly protein PilF